VAKENVARHRSFHNKRTILPAAPEAPVATTAAGSTGVVGRRKPRRAVEAEQVNGQQGTGEVRQLNTDAILKQLVPESNRNSNRNSGTERQERIVDVATGSVYYRGKLLGKVSLMLIRHYTCSLCNLLLSLYHREFQYFVRLFLEFITV
jgi:hypothetical protein